VEKRIMKELRVAIDVYEGFVIKIVMNQSQ
jgi:hypothetical protein